MARHLGRQDAGAPGNNLSAHPNIRVDSYPRYLIMLQNVGKPIAMKISRPLLLALALCSAIFASRAEESTAVECLKTSSFFATPDSSDYRKYAPDRDVDILH